ncbi:VPS9 domain-containing protein [Citrus sinensis]|nr:VPS9 domain-containing protein [Citrus sinensis]
MNSIIGSSIWQQNLEYQQARASLDNEHETWGNTAARLNSVSHLRNESMDKNVDDYYYRKFCFNDMPSRNLSVKMHPATDHHKWYKTLPPGEMLPRNEVLGGYIFVCNNETMQEDLRRQLFGLPQKYKDSVRAITPGLPLFLYNYTSHQLHGVFQAVSFGGSNIDPTAWEDKKCRGESRFPAQVRIRIKKICKPLEEDAFRPILYHYDGPKFRLQLSVPEHFQMDTSSSSSASAAAPSAVTFYDFLDRMRNPASLDLVRSIKSFIVSFSFNNANPENDGKRVQEFFTTMESAIKDHPLWANATIEAIESAMEGLEKYVMTKLFSRTFASTSEDVKIDQEISEKICLLQTFLRPEHLDIPTFLQNEASWLLAEKELQKINALKAPREKVLCIMNCCRIINNLLLNASISENVELGGADDFLPVLIYIIIKASPILKFLSGVCWLPANPPQLHSNIKFIQLYRRQAMLVSEAAYYFTNLVSAKTFILDLNAKSLSMEETEFEKSMQAARLANKVTLIEESTTSNGIKTLGEQGHPVIKSERHDVTRIEASAMSNDRKSLEEQRRVGPSQRIYGNNTITSGELQTPKISGGGYGYPFMEAEASQLTTGDVEKLLSVYKDVVRKYTNLCRAVRHVSVPMTVAPIPHFEGNNSSFKQPATKTSTSTDSKREE